MVERERREIRFRSTHDHLAGSLFLPSGAGPCPAIVMLQGSGHTDRTNNGYFPPIRDHFVSCGFAVLEYDKPGAGESSGDWRTKNLSDRATESLDAVAYLQSLDEIDARNVGLFGHSQGGWVVQISASLSPAVAFIIAQAGPGIPPRIQYLHDVKHSMLRDGYNDHNVRQALNTARSLIAAGNQGVDYASVHENILLSARDNAWSSYLSIPDEAMWRYLSASWRQDPDPRDVLAHVTCPVLALFGELDHLLPVAESVAVYQQALAEAGNSNLTVKIFPDANHRIQVGDAGTFAAGYFDILREWLSGRH